MDKQRPRYATNRIGHIWLDMICSVLASVVHVRGMCIQQHMCGAVGAGGAQQIHGQRAVHAPAFNPHL